jgi:hypothetical protein
MLMLKLATTLHIMYTTPGNVLKRAVRQSELRRLKSYRTSRYFDLQVQERTRQNCWNILLDICLAKVKAAITQGTGRYRTEREPTAVWTSSPPNILTKYANVRKDSITSTDKGWRTCGTRWQCSVQYSSAISYDTQWLTSHLTRVTPVEKRNPTVWIFLISKNDRNRNTCFFVFQGLPFYGIFDLDLSELCKECQAEFLNFQTGIRHE